MPFTTNFQGPGFGKKQREAVIQALTPLFAYRPGKWHIQFITDRHEVEMRVSGPGVETSDYIDVSLDTEVITGIVAGILAPPPPTAT